MRKKTAALYCRVSTSEQSTAMQRLDLRRYCTERGWLMREYVDVGVSGAKDRRPGLDDLMADARKLRFDVVMVWRFDRFARSTRHLVSALEEFRHLGIDFVSYQENIDTSSPIGRALFTIISAIAELERSIISERVKGGMRRAKAAGKKIGRPSVAVALQEQLRYIAQQGTVLKSVRALAAELGVSKSAVHKALQISTGQPVEKLVDVARKFMSEKQ